MACEAKALIPFTSNGPLIFWIYPVLGIRGAGWFLGVSQWLAVSRRSFRAPREINRDLQRRRKLRRCLQFFGGQAVHREVESERHDEEYRAVIEGAIPQMNRSAKGGTRWSLLYRGEGVTHSAVAPRCLRMARYGRSMCDLRRTGGSRAVPEGTAQSASR